MKWHLPNLPLTSGTSDRRSTRQPGWQWYSSRRRRWTPALRSLNFGLATDAHRSLFSDFWFFVLISFTIFADKDGSAVEELPEWRPEADVLLQVFEEREELLYVFSRAFPPPQTAACMADSTGGSVSHQIRSVYVTRAQTRKNTSRARTQTHTQTPTHIGLYPH